MSRRRCRKRRTLKIVIQQLISRIQDPNTDGETIDKMEFEISKIRQKLGE